MSFNKVSPLLERYQRLIDISRDLASTLDLDTLLNRIVQSAADLIDAQAASVLLYDEAKQQLHFEVATNLEEPMMRGLVVPVDNSIAGWIVTNRQPIIIPNAQEDPRHFGGISEATNTDITSMIGVPLITKTRVIGVLEAINKRNGTFSEEDLNLLTALGAQVAVAIHNARLFQQSDLISELVHEIRTPLASLQTASHLLLRPELPDETRSRMVDIINDETMRLTKMTTAFLDLAKLESGRAQFSTDVFEIAGILEDSATIMRSRAEEKGIQLISDIPEKLPPVYADPNKIKQVVLNLLSNAIKYNRPNGTVYLSACAAGEVLSFSVRDTGQGMMPEHLSHLFEKFYRVPGSEVLAGGTGLGLAICKRIVEAHKGNIEVQSTVGEGTTFTVHLPTYSGDTAGPGEQAPTSPAAKES